MTNAIFYLSFSALVAFALLASGGRAAPQDVEEATETAERDRRGALSMLAMLPILGGLFGGGASQPAMGQQQSMYPQHYNPHAYHHAMYPTQQMPYRHPAQPPRYNIGQRPVSHRESDMSSHDEDY